MAAEPNDLIDGFTSLEAGVNSGLSPNLLPRNQAAFATNTTFRGGYARNRPGMRKLQLDFGGDDALEEAFTQAVFQGSAYFNSELGYQALIAAIGGKLFKVEPGSEGVATVEDVGISGDPNSAAVPISWLWQAERFMIVNDGINLPIFFDGVSSRRSTGSGSQTAAVTAADFTVPAVGATVEIEITEPWSQGTDIDVQIDGDTYTVVSARSSSGSSYTLETTQAWGAPTAFPAGTELGISTAFSGHVTVESPAGSWNKNTNRTLTLSRPCTAPVGALCDLLIHNNNTGLDIHITATVVSVAGNTVTVKNSSISYSNVTVEVGSPLLQYGGTWTTFATSAAFNSPGTGLDVDIDIEAGYTGPVPGYVVTEDRESEFYVNAVVINGSSQYYVTVRNVTGTEGEIKADPQNIATEVQELPVGRMGAYGMGRVWMCLADGRSFIGSDIVGSSSGTAAYNYRDAVLKVTENDYLAGGGTFVVPGNVGDITAMVFTATLDASLGQGPLQVGTPTTMFSVDAPVDRSTWQDVTNPILTQSLKGYGPLSQYGTVLANSDLIFRSHNGISSLILARREFDTWGNTPISREVERVIEGDSETLLQSATAIIFDNRLLMGCLPSEGALGIYHRGIVALNFDPVSSLRGKAPSIYDGLWTGLNVLQLVNGTFNSEQRAFAFCYSESDGKIELWEILTTEAQENFDENGQPITWSVESPMLFQNVRGKEMFEMCTLRDGEVFLSNIEGKVYVQVWYRPEYSTCWIPWHSFGVCASDDSGSPKQFRSGIGLGVPSAAHCETTNGLTTNVARCFQFRIQITGACDLIGARFRAVPTPHSRFAPLICDALCAVTGNATPCEPCRTISDCLEFDPVFYNLNSNERYENEEGDVTYILPYPAGLQSEYPPLFINCGESTAVKRISAGATQEQIDAVVLAAIAECE